MSNLTQRVITAAVAIPLILAICMFGGIIFAGFITIISAIALAEFYTMCRAKGAHPQVGLGIVAGSCVTLSFYHRELRYHISGLFEGFGVAIPFPGQEQLLMIVLVLATVALSLAELFRNKGSAIINLSTTIFGILYISLFFGTFVGLRELFSSFDPPVAGYFLSRIGSDSPEMIYRAGGFTVISVFAMIWICDSAAFHVGMAMGRRKLFPRVSPNKSWEGALAGYAFAIITAIAAKYVVLDYLSLGSAIILGMIVGLVGQLGDLMESLLKRDAGVKDSSALIPGHGGAFDRFDSLLLVSPLVFLYLDFVVF